MSKKQRTYSIDWRRDGEEEVQTCRKLTPTKLVARLIKLLRHQNKVEILRVEKEEENEYEKRK